MVLAAGLYEWLLLLHILAAMVWLGGLIVLNVLAILVLRGGEPGSIGRFVANLRVIGPLTLAPSILAVVGFGIWLVLDSGAWGFRQAWIWVALILFSAAFLVGPHSRAARRSQRSEQSSPATAARRSDSWGAGRGGCD